MFYVRAILVITLILLPGCNIDDDLWPSDSDKRPDITVDANGNMPGQKVTDFVISDTLGNEFVLYDHLQGGSKAADVVVLYFTMWCAVCLAHSDDIYNNIIPRFANRGTVVYTLVDFVSGDIDSSRLAELANGYGGFEFVTLVDKQQQLLKQFNATMATVVVIGNDGTVLLNEDYRNGKAFEEVMEQILP